MLSNTFITNTFTEHRKYSKFNYDETVQSVVTPCIRHPLIAALMINIVRLYHFFEIRCKLREFKQR